MGTPMVLPDSIADQPEAGFLQFISPPDAGKTRDTVIMVAEERTLLYWLLRSLGLQPDEVQTKIDAYSVAPASVTLVNVDKHGQMEVLSVSDKGHLPMDSLPAM